MLAKPTEDNVSTFEDLWELVGRGRGDDRHSFQRISRNAANETFARAADAVDALLDGDVDGGTMLMRRAIRCASPEEASYLADILIPVLVNRGDLEAAEDLTRYEAGAERLLPCFVASRAVLSASRGDLCGSRLYSAEAMRMLSGTGDDAVYSRVLMRLALAAYGRGELNEAFERAASAAHWCERVGSWRFVCTANSMLYAIAIIVYDDGEAALGFARQIQLNAALAGDVAQEKLGNLCLVLLSAELGDSDLLETYWRAYHRRQCAEQFVTEAFHIGIVSVLHNGWRTRFDLASESIEAIRRSPNLTLAEKALCDALAAAACVATWDLRKARSLARLTISETISPRGHELHHEKRRRKIARALAALVCLSIGDTTRGRRALSSRSGLATAFGDLDVLVGSAGVDETKCPPLMRGYVRFLNSALRRSAAMRPRCALTTAESEVLRALWDGTTLVQVAATLGKSPKTVRCQVASIYTKLGASSRTQALCRAEELGIARPRQRSRRSWHRVRTGARSAAKVLGTPDRPSFG